MSTPSRQTAAVLGGDRPGVALRSLNTRGPLDFRHTTAPSGPDMDALTAVLRGRATERAEHVRCARVTAAGPCAGMVRFRTSGVGGVFGECARCGATKALEPRSAPPVGTFGGLGMVRRGRS